MAVTSVVSADSLYASESFGFNSSEMQNNSIPNGRDPPILNKTLLLAGWKVSGSWSFRGTYDLLVQSWKSGTWSSYDCASKRELLMFPTENESFFIASGL